jgi:6-phosphogluconate dehydrogenase
MKNADVGMIGLAVMGQNLARNLESRGYTVAVFNRTQEVLEKFMTQFEDKKFVPAYTLKDFVASLEAPRKIFIMIKSGHPVDAVLDELLPLLDKGDIVIDGGNAYFEETVRREKFCTEKGIHFLGVGISGGETGALNGPSLMPGGPVKAWEKVQEMLRSIAAQYEGEPCVEYIGPDGAGHFVKMVHNGIEYADMQLIAECYDLLSKVTKLGHAELADVFAEWNNGILQSYLIEITSKIFTKRDPDSNDVYSEEYLVDKILDKAGQKGTGKWTVQVALDLGISVPTIASAVDARAISSLKDERESASVVLSDFDHGNAKQRSKIDIKRDRFVNLMHDALYCAKVIAYAQGMFLLTKASEEWKWDLKLSEIASIWRDGCIIRARLLDAIKEAYRANPTLTNLLLAPSIRNEMLPRIDALREVIATAMQFGIPCAAMAASLSYFDAYRSAVLPLKLTQAQRDFFGAHTYERIDRPGIFHTQWESA